MSLLSRAVVVSALVLGTSAGALSPAGALARTSDDRLPAAVTRHTPDYDFELVLQPLPDQPEVVLTYVRRTDDVGRGFEDVPDSHGFVRQTSWSVLGGRRCLTSGGGVFSFPDAPDHAFTFGLTGRAVHRVVVQLADGTKVRTRTTHHMVGEFRGWMVERPLEDVVKVVGLDKHGRRVATATPFDTFTDYAHSDTCTPLPFP